MSFLNEFPILKTIQAIAAKEKVSVYLVGGFLRDYILKRPCVDFDFAVDKNALKVAKSFSTRIKGAYVLLDKDRGCARVVRRIRLADLARSRQKSSIFGGLKTGEIHTFDFADFRARTLRGDLTHRDFTINTLSVDLAALNATTKLDEVLCDYKRALVDIRAKKIRMASAKAFKEDPLRLLRAFSLKAMLDFTIEKDTLAQIKKDKDLLTDVSYERIREELFKILATSKAALNLKAMDKIGLLEKIIPQVSVMYNCKQGTYHHLDVWPHSLETVVQLEKLLKETQGNEDISLYLNKDLGGNHKRRDILKLAALLHDIGKPETRKRENGRLTFHGHEHVGRSIVRSVAKLLKISTRERHVLEDMVLWHLRPGYLSNFKQPSDRAVYRYFRDTKDEGVSILLLSLADQRSTRGPLTTQKDQKHHEKICMDLITKYFLKKKEKVFVRLINGNDLIKKLKLKPSPLFAKILQEVEEKQVLGKISTKSEALELAKKIGSRK